MNTGRHVNQLETVPIDSIERDPQNAMDHPDRNIDDIRRSLATFGQVEPLLVHHGTIIHGSGRHAAMVAAGWETVEIRRCDDLTEPQARALSIAMNRTAQSAEWNLERLNVTIAELEADGWDVGDIGFDTAELDELLAEFRPAEPIPEPEPQIDRAAELQKEWGTETGQLWTIKSPRWVFCPKCNKLHRVTE